MQRLHQITARRSVLLWASTGLVVVAAAVLMGHLLGPHAHSHLVHVAAVADDEVDHDPAGHGDDGETACGYLVRVDSDSQPAADSAMSAITVRVASRDRDIASVGSSQDGRAPPDLTSVLQVIRI